MGSTGATQPRPDGRTMAASATGDEEQQPLMTGEDAPKITAGETKDGGSHGEAESSERSGASSNISLYNPVSPEPGKDSRCDGSGCPGKREIPQDKDSGSTAADRPKSDVPSLPSSQATRHSQLIPRGGPNPDLNRNKDSDKLENANHDKKPRVTDNNNGSLGRPLPNGTAKTGDYVRHTPEVIQGTWSPWEGGDAGSRNGGCQQMKDGSLSASCGSGDLAQSAKTENIPNGY